ncbi:Metallo-hydrolase/oxidoreductase [Trametes elegans]|nr:Metallo-hydrolase/oxidoreductase [Trametes elegans]
MTRLTKLPRTKGLDRQRGGQPASTVRRLRDSARLTFWTRRRSTKRYGTMSDLPSPTPDQAYCRVSALEAGTIRIPLPYVIDTAQEGETKVIPSLSFLLRHSKSGDTFVFDLGIRKDLSTLPPAYLKRIDKMGFVTSVPQDAADSLAKGGLAPTDITHLCLSHLHFDHIGDPAPYTRATVLAGAGGQPLVAHGWPADPDSLFAQDLLPAGRTRFLDPAGWPPLGPFPHALDLHGDGSVFVVDAGAGHVAGHVNVLARTSADGGWVYLAGDSAHDRRLLTGEARIPVHDFYGCAHRDRGAAEEHLARIRALMEASPRVRVILAHDAPWYELNKDGPAFWPGVMDSL